MKLFDLACTVPWLMPEPAVQALLAASLRESDPAELARQMHGRPEALAFKAGTKRDDSRTLQMRDGVALIDITGPIFRYADFFTEVSGGITTEALALDLQRALDDPQVRAVLFAIDSPGGEATGINELADAIYAARDRKPVWAYIAGYGASAAYWIASAASEIVIDDTALVGSIGTVFAVQDPTQRTAKTIEFVSSQSPNKRPNPTTEAGKSTLQALVDGMTDVFVAKVARNRGVSPETVLSDFGQGGMLIGQAAIAAGMADRLGSFEGTLAQLAIRSAPASRTFPLSPTPQRRALAAGTFTAEEIDSMDWKKVFGGLFAAAAEVEQAQAAEPAAEPAPPEQPAPEAAVTAADPRVAELEAQLAERTRASAEALTAQIEKDATAFAAAAVAERRAFPPEAEALAGLYRLCASADAAAGVTAQVDALRASTEARLQHSVTTEAVPVAQQVLTSGSATKLDAKRRKELLSATPLGQAAISQK